MATDIERPLKLAVLIDADNASPRIVSGLFEEIASLGEPIVRRIYGNFSGPRLNAWKEQLGPYAIIAQQNFANTVGKNASDIALVIDAMDLLHTGRFDGFCLVSSDSDFTRLASRIREQGVDVYGFGEEKTPESFRQACKRFFYTENLIVAEPAPPTDQPEPAVAGVEKKAASPPPAQVKKQSPTAAVPLLRKAMQSLDDVDGWYALGPIGARLNILHPDFDPRSYGCPKLVTLVEKSGQFNVRRQDKSVAIQLKAKKRWLFNPPSRQSRLAR